MRYKILFFGEDESMTITKDQYTKISSYLDKNPQAKFIWVGEEIINTSAIKRFATIGKEELPELPEGKVEPINLEEFKEMFKMKSWYRSDIENKLSNNDRKKL